MENEIHADHQSMDLGTTDNQDQQETRESIRSNTPTGIGIRPWQPSDPLPQAASSPSTRTGHLEEPIPTRTLPADFQSHSEHLRSQIENQKKFLENLHSQKDALNRSLLALREMMDDLHSSTSDGTFMWRVENVPTLFNDTRVNHIQSLRSPCFYSSPTGYKMRASMHLYRVPGTSHVFIFVSFIVCRGPFDGIMSWPFTFPVVTCLFDQTEAKSHKIDLMRPDLTTNCFDRPQSDTNPGSLIARWGPFNSGECAANSFVQGNTMFIKVMVDFQDTPLRILPYLIALNPGLPASEQEAWRQAQLKKVEELRLEHTGSIQKLREEDEMARQASISFSRLPESSDH